MSYALMDLAVYAGLIPSLMVITYRRFLNRVQVVYGVDLILDTALGILSVVLATRGIHNQFIYPVLAVKTGVTMGLLLSGLATDAWLKLAIRLAYGMYVLYVLLTGFSQLSQFMNLNIFLFLNASIAGLSFFFLISLIRNSHSLRKKSLFWLLLALFLGTFYDLAISQVGTLIAQYGGNRWQDLFWLKINPVVTIIKLSIITYGFYLARFQLIKSDKLPHFKV
ncbi:hypothetical protein [Fibrella forsythiae]|uniref:Uncharacterized protein n=1 Tax=Fibrella forsythiae TaxID=2817061 RepID=A0ABS3JMM0_9BACT|nr:hypothetical protein [Fibrella forsythiae]MBO0951244.1 hypothetical protein [Fibrella forsythiae]